MFLTNGDLEAAYFDWKSAMARIPQVANYPNTNLAPSFSYMFSNEQMKTWDRTTVNIGFDPMENLSFPTKVAKAGEAALENARAAGRKFEVVKFDLQQKVLTAYLDLELHEEKIRIQQRNVSLLKALADSSADRLRAGGSQQDMLRAQTQYRLAENELASMESEHMTMKAMLNGMMARNPSAPLTLPESLSPPRQVAVDDARLIAVATDNNPELSRLAREVAGREDALELARMGFIPDINPFAALTGSISQSVGAMLVIPTTVPEIRGRIDEARAMLRSSQAMLRQAKFDKAAAFVAALYVMRNSERQALVFEQTIRPRAEQAFASARDAYVSGQGSFIDLIDSQRTLLDVRQMIAEIRIEREKRLGELEALAGVDIESLAGPTTAPSTQYAPQTSESAASSNREVYEVP
jgi:outer membrane protein TolC